MMARATIILALLLPLLGGCVSDHDKDSSDVVSSSSPKRYEDDPDKKKQVCEDSLVGGEPKTICY